MVGKFAHLITANVYAGFVRVRPVRKASELVRRPVNGPRAVRSSKFQGSTCQVTDRERVFNGVIGVIVSRIRRHGRPD